MSLLSLALSVADERERERQPADEKNELNEIRPSLNVATVVALLEMSLDEYKRRGAPMEIRTRWLPLTVWFVPDERHASALVADGISRGRIWTATELKQLLTLADRTHAVVTLATAKWQMDGYITEVRSQRPRSADGREEVVL